MTERVGRIAAYKWVLAGCLLCSASWAQALEPWNRSYAELGVGMAQFEDVYDTRSAGGTFSVGFSDWFYVRLEGYSESDSGDSSVEGFDFTRYEVVLGAAMPFKEWFYFLVEAGPLQGSFETRDGERFDENGGRFAGGVGATYGPWTGTLKAVESNFNRSIHWSGQEFGVGYRVIDRVGAHLRFERGGQAQLLRLFIRYDL